MRRLDLRRYGSRFAGYGGEGVGVERYGGWSWCRKCGWDAGVYGVEAWGQWGEV